MSQSYKQLLSHRLLQLRDPQLTHISIPLGLFRSLQGFRRRIKGRLPPSLARSFVLVPCPHPFCRIVRLMKQGYPLFSPPTKMKLISWVPRISIRARCVSVDTSKCLCSNEDKNNIFGVRKLQSGKVKPTPLLTISITV